MGPKDDKEATCLNQIIRWESGGLEYEAASRHAQKLIEVMQLEGANAVATPVIKALPAQVDEDVVLDINLHTRFRGFAARAKHLAADLPDI